MGFRKLKYLLPSYRRAQEREMREELESLSGVAGPRELGNLTLVAENAREAWGWMWLERLSQDLRYAGRSLRRNSSFTAAAILTLALGIGANTAIFTAINAVFFKPLPVKHHKDLRLLSWTSRKRAFAGPILMQPMYDAYILNQGDTIKSFSYPAYEKIRDHTTSFSDISCVRSGLDVSLVSGNHFRMLGVDAYLGRIIAPEDDRIGGPAVADISYGFWQSAFGGDPSVLNKTVKRAATTFRIVGVLPPDFFGLDPGAPLANIQAAMQPAFNKPELLNDHRNWSGGCVAVVGRIRPDVSDEQARAESETFVRQSILEDPPSETYEMPRLWITSADRGLDTLRRKTAFPLLVLMSVASVILWIGCANIAGLQLARGMARQKEIAARLSVGAPRIRIVRQLLTESLALSSIGGVAGGALAYAANPLLPRLFTQFNSYTFNHLGVALTPDLRVLGFCFALTTLTGLLFGLAPAMRATRIDLVSMMKTDPPARTRFHFTSGKTMLGIQVALTTLLLMGTGLFIRTLLNLRAVPLGYDPNGLIWFTIDTDANRSDFVNTVVRRLENLPGVTSATASIWPLFTSAPDTYTPVCESGEAPRKFDDRFADSDFILPRFFETWRVPLLRGRDFEASEGQRNIIVNESFVRRYLAGKDPIGQTVQVGRGCPSWTIVGVAADSTDRPRITPRPFVYFRYTNQKTQMTFTIRTSGDPASLVPPLTRMISGLGTRTFEPPTTGVEYRDRTMIQERLFTSLLAAFGSLALLISSLGIYGLLIYLVARRTPEIGLRMALGAQRGDVLRMVIRESLVPVGIGIALGWISSFGLTRLVQNLLFEVSRGDPWAVAGTAAVLLFTAGMAAFLPARRAARIDPMRALHYE